MLGKLLLYVNTIKYLKISQIYFRILRKIYTPQLRKSEKITILPRSYNWQEQILYNEKIDENFNAHFLNFSKKLNFPSCWYCDGADLLWVYNLHYFEDLISVNSPSKYEFHLTLFDQWIDDNPPGAVPGWSPYPSSLRVCNLLKAYLSGLPLEERHIKSIYEQADAVSKNLEKHLLGNHYFVNLKALYFSGILFQNKVWLNTAVQGFKKEIPEQILEDGAYFELSPMYHALILVDILDICNLSRAFPEHSSIEVKNLTESVIPAMLAYVDDMSHSDNEIAFFNDAANGVAPTLDIILQYAEKLGFKQDKPDIKELNATDYRHSGFYVAQTNHAKLIFDAGSVGPKYIPGHAHADTLSFELSISNERLFVNSGVSTYTEGAQRSYERGTLAHNTVSVNSEDSSQVWSSFRVAKRAEVFTRQMSEVDSAVRLYACHDGYKKIYGGPVHCRELEFRSESLSIIDCVGNHANNAVSRFFFHPEINISVDNDRLYFSGNRFRGLISLRNWEYQLKNSEWYPEFGLSYANRCLEVYLPNKKMPLDITWSIN